MSSNNQFDELDIAVIKLTNGQTIVSTALYVNETEQSPEHIQVFCPMTMTFEEDENNEMDVLLFPWLYGADNHTAAIYYRDIICAEPASMDIINQYKESVDYFFNEHPYSDSLVQNPQSNKPVSRSINEEQIEATVADIMYSTTMLPF